MTDRQRAALDHLDDPVLPNAALDIARIWGSARPLIVDIGFGHGESTIALAQRYPEAALLAVDVHPPGIARLLQAIAAQRIDNIRIVPGSIIDVLDVALAECRIEALWTLFPDPWPKARHHKRRLLQPDLLTRMAARTDPGATWHIATDWANYAEHIVDVFVQSSDWVGGVCARPERPVTKYEDRARRAGRPVTDFAFTRIS